MIWVTKTQKGRDHSRPFVLQPLPTAHCPFCFTLENTLRLVIEIGGTPEASATNTVHTNFVEVEMTRPEPRLITPGRRFESMYGSVLSPAPECPRWAH